MLVTGSSQFTTMFSNDLLEEWGCGGGGGGGEGKGRSMVCLMGGTDNVNPFPNTPF